jgi:hypothetical protein
MEMETVANILAVKFFFSSFERAFGSEVISS